MLMEYFFNRLFSILKVLVIHLGFPSAKNMKKYTIAQRSLLFLVLQNHQKCGKITPQIKVLYSLSFKQTRLTNITVSSV